MDATDLDHKIVDLFYLKTGYTYREGVGLGLGLGLRGGGGGGCWGWSLQILLELNYLSCI